MATITENVVVTTAARPAKVPKTKFRLKIMTEVAAVPIIAEENVEYCGLDMSLAKQAIKLIGNNVLRCKKILYIYWGRLWSVDIDKKKLQLLVIEKLLIFYKECFDKETQILSNMLMKVGETTDPQKKITDKVLKIIKDLKTDNKQKSILSQVILLLPDSEVEFDIVQPFYFVFNNVAFDMKARKEVIIKREDYITQSARYDFIKPKPEDITAMKQKLQEILPNEDYRDCYISVLRSGCTGVRLEKLIMANGGGRNGKGLLSALMAIMLGDDYYYDGNALTLTDKIRAGANPEIANMNKKRSILFKEPEANASLQLGMIRALTGDDTINARGLYSTDTKTRLQGTIILEVNGKPAINGKIDESAVERWVNVNFPNCFTDDPSLIDNITKFAQDRKYKTLEWQEQMRHALFQILLDCPYDTIHMPKRVRNETMDYLLDNDTLLKWFNEYYEIVKEETSVVTVAQMFATLYESDFYQCLSKKAKREEYTKKGLLQKIKDNIKLKLYYHDRKKIDGMEYYTFLSHCKKRQIETTFNNIDPATDEDDD